MERGSQVKITICIDAELNSENEEVSKEELIAMLLDDPCYCLKSVSTNDTHELLYKSFEIDVEEI